MGIVETETSTSTSTGAASIPISVYDASFASMGVRRTRGVGARRRRALLQSSIAHGVGAEHGGGRGCPGGDPRGMMGPGIRVEPGDGFMGTIETFDHTADVGLRVRGDDLDDLFRTAAEGVFDYVVANRLEVGTDQIEKISLRDDSTLDLLATWISELIFLSEIASPRFCRDFEVHVGEDGLPARCDGPGRGDRPGPAYP